jgi:hypothetical protein
MRLFRVLTGAWKSIVLDFIIKLPLSKEALTGVKYDLILIIIDRLTKYVYLILYKKGLTAEELVYTCQGSRESTGIQGMTMDPQAVGLRMTGLSQSSNDN